MITMFLFNHKTVEVDIYDVCKYTVTEEDFQREKKVVYEGVVGFEVVGGKEAEEIEAHTDGSCIDDYHEYLVLYLEDGDSATFRNSYVDMFAF